MEYFKLESCQKIYIQQTEISGWHDRSFHLWGGKFYRQLSNLSWY